MLDEPEDEKVGFNCEKEKRSVFENSLVDTDRRRV